jgi:molecular chaperone IbpA
MSYIATLPKHWVGFDSLLNDLERFSADAMKKIPNWPPYNIRKVDNDHYVIELAVAGFARSDIDITTKENELVITGEVKSDPEANYLHKGIAERSFERSFTLADTVVVKNASLVNGMLKVWLEHIIPEEKKPKKVVINDAEVPDLKTVAEPDLLLG